MLNSMAGMTPNGRQPAAAIWEDALAYVRELASRGLSPLQAVIGGTAAPVAFEQYPQAGVTWIGARLGYFYHSHGPALRGGAAHGHFHLFAQCGARRAGDLRGYAHLIGIEVDGTGRPLSLFATNLWVTAGEWRSAAFVGRELRRFASVATGPDGGPERWIGLILHLFMVEVGNVLRLRDQRVREWRRKGVARRRLADRRIGVLARVSLPM